MEKNPKTSLKKCLDSLRNRRLTLDDNSPLHLLSIILATAILIF